MEEQHAIDLLKKYAPDERSYNIVLDHSRAVEKAAIRIAKQIRGVDMEVIRNGSLLHDIGRFKHPPGKDSIKHGIAGADILRKEGRETYARIAERHLGAGISKEDIKKHHLPLPEKDYLPETVEEKILAYADNLIAGTEERDIQYVIDRFAKEIGKEAVDRVIALHNELEILKGCKRFL